MLSVRLGEKTFVCDCVTKRSLNFWNNLPTNPFTKTYTKLVSFMTLRLPCPLLLIKQRKGGESLRLLEWVNVERC